MRKTTTFSNLQTSVATNFASNVSEKIFKRKLTRLNVTITVTPGDTEILEEVSRKRDEFLDMHDYIEMEILTQRTMNCIVGDNTEDLPFRYNPKLFFVISILGLAMPYSWLLYLSVGHVNYRVVKKVTSIENSSHAIVPILDNVYDDKEETYV